MTRSKNADMLKSVLAKLLIAALLVSSVITGGFGISVQAAAQPAISKTKASVLVGKKVQLGIKNPIKKATYKWKSDNKKIATVNSKGVVTGVKKGSATIICTVTTARVTQYLTSKVTVVEPAEKIVINNKIISANVGQVYDLNRSLTPSSSNDPTTWKSSDPEVIVLGKWGKFTALKEGTATIVATTSSGVSDKVTIKVIDREGIVTTQKELESLLGSGAGLITLKTEEAVSFTIPEGNYGKQKIVIDAPNANVTNNGIFKEMEIKAIKAVTCTEKAIGNLITILAPTANIIIDKGANASITVAAAGTVLDLINNGIINSLIVNEKSVISISGTSLAAIPVTNNAAGALISTSIPLAVISNAKFGLTVLPGAEATTLKAASEEVIPTVTGDVTITVTVGTGENTFTKIIIGDTGSGSGGSSSGSSSGGGSSGSSSTTKTITKSADGSYTLPVAYTKLTKVVVKYSGISYTVDSTLLSVLRGFLNNESAAISTWKNTTDTTMTYSGQKVNVSGTKGSTLKTVTFSGGLLDGKAYQVEVDETSHAVTVTGGSGTSYRISKSADNKTLYITNAPDSLSFVVTY